MSDFPFTYVETWSHSYGPSDPVNVLAKGIKLDDLVNFLVKESNWHITDVAEDRYMPKKIGTLDFVKQDRQLAYDGILNRVHLRLWNFPPELPNGENYSLLGSVHQDATRLYGHRASDFEVAKHFLAETCSGNSKGWKVLTDGINLDNEVREFEVPYHCGWALLVDSTGGMGP